MADSSRGALRAFVALDLDAPSLRRMVRLSDRLRMGSGAPSAAWTPAAHMHVTLRFMAKLSVDRVEALKRALAPLAGEVARAVGFGLRLAAFPAATRARVVVAELKDEGGPLAKLAEKVDRLAVKAGVPAEDRKFRPHVTLARLKRPYDSRRWIRPELAEGVGECHLSALTLYESQLGSDGPIYLPLVRFPAAADPAG